MWSRIINFLKNWLFNQVPTTKPAEVEGVINPILTPSTLPQIRVDKMICYDSEKKIINEAVEMANKFIVSKEFEKAVLNFKFSNTNGKSNREIYEMYRNISISIGVEMFIGNFYQNKVSKTVGYEMNSEGYIRLNRYFVKKPVHVCSTLMHEIGHYLGFSHPHLEQDSVNYGMNQIVEAYYANN